jgi:hypothetical protein
MSDLIRDIEMNYPVAQIKDKGMQIWPYLRIHYISSHNRETQLKGMNTNIYVNLPFSIKVKMVTGFFSGFFNWFSTYEYIALTSANCRRDIKGRKFNIFIDQIIEETGADKFLTIETPAPNYLSASRTPERKIVSSGIISLISWLVQKFAPLPADISGESILKELEHKHGLRISYKRLIRRFNLDRNIYRCLFRWLKPKYIFLTCYYGKEPAIKAAHDLGIKVIEIQHGTIGYKTPAYNISAKLDKSCFPDYLFVYGGNDSKVFDNGMFIDPSNVYTVGSYYIEYIKEHSEPGANYPVTNTNYSKLIGFTLQLGLEGITIDFINKAANLDKTICYLLIPRQPSTYFNKLDIPDNVIISSEENFYQTMTYVDFHSTIFSTCALEAPSLGVQNILINYDNLSRYYYEDVLNNEKITRFVDTPEEYVKEINSFEKLDRATIIQLNEQNIRPGYKNNLRTALKEILR